MCRNSEETEPFSKFIKSANQNLLARILITRFYTLNNGLGHTIKSADNAGQIARMFPGR